MQTRFSHISTLIVKVTHRCNLDCTYCYEHITKTGKDMPLEIFAELARLALSETRERAVNFLFHGGEPTLLPNAWYDEAIATAKNLARQQGKEARFSMQTNLLGITDSKIELFRRHNISLGISLDGPASLQSSQRGGEDKVFQHFKRLQREGIRAGVLMTINQSNYEQFFMICDWLVREAAINSFKANVVTPVGRGVDMPPMQAEQIFAAQHAILQYMIQTRGETLIEDNLATELLRFFATDQERAQMPHSLCHEKRCGAGEQVLGVTPEGHLLPCGRFTWDEAEYYLGHIADSDSVESAALADFRQKIDQFQDLVPQSWYDCEACPARKVCGFGCQAFIVRSKQQANLDCLPTKMRFAFYEAHKAALLPVVEAIRRKNQPKQRPATPFRIRQADGTIKSYELRMTN